MISVIIKYKLNGKNSFRTLELTPAEYFDEGEDESEVDSIPKFNSAAEYLQLEPSALEETAIQVLDAAAGDSRSLTQKYWNDGKNCTCERVDTVGGKETYWELILEIQLAETPPEWEILRFGKVDGQISLGFHSRIRKNADGSESLDVIFSKHRQAYM